MIILALNVLAFLFLVLFAGLGFLIAFGLVLRLVCYFLKIDLE